MYSTLLNSLLENYHDTLGPIFVDIFHLENPFEKAGAVVKGIHPSSSFMEFLTDNHVCHKINVVKKYGERG